MLHAVVLAGGTGKRFWPESRIDRPKQLLRLASKRSLLKETLARFRRRVPPERTLVLTAAVHGDAVRRQARALPAANVIVEPVGRDTAASIGLAAIHARARDRDAMLAVAPCDHVIQPAKRFREALRAGESVAKDGSLVVFGVPPTFPSTSYGYIRAGEPRPSLRGFPIHDVLHFVEKPDRERAEACLREGGYLWNSGIFVWRADAILAEILAYVPPLAAALGRISAFLGTDREEEIVEQEFEKLEPISIDYGVLERSNSVRVVSVDFEWNDVGTWRSVESLLPRDQDGNAVRGKHCGIDTRGCTVVGEDRLIATVGLRDLIVVQTRDATLICHRDRAEDVKRLVDHLEEAGFEEYL